MLSENLTDTVKNSQPATKTDANYLDALSRVAVWGPVGIYGALGKDVPDWMKFVMLGTSVLQIMRGFRELRELNQK